jgi:hypothetical protein
LILVTYFVYITYNTYCTYFVLSADWLDKCDSKIIYERRMQSLVLYVVPISSILGRLALVSVGDTGTIPFSMCHEKPDFDGATCDSRMALVTGIYGGMSTVMQ